MAVSQGRRATYCLLEWLPPVPTSGTEVRLISCKQYLARRPHIRRHEAQPVF